MSINQQLTFLVTLLTLLTSCNNHKSLDQTVVLLDHIEKQLSYATEVVDSLVQLNPNLVSPRTTENNTLKLVPARDWTSGFYAGELWMTYELSKNEFWKMEAQKHTTPLEQEKWNGRTHDMGFKMYCSYGNGYRLTNDTTYKRILIQSANTLITRYNPKVGCIRSWDHQAHKWSFPVIIDNMMNLELLFWASKETGDSTYRNIAINHAQTTMRNHFRSDYSCYHVVDYNPESGEVNVKATHQGYNDESAWSRGQAWAIYGYTMMYRETKDLEFLEQAKHIANFIINHPRLPKDLVPYWDFDAPGIPDEPRDASAAAVICSALYELATLTNNNVLYLNAANKMFESLSSNTYLAKPRTNHGFLLMHSTGSKAHNSEVDVPLIYADYYFLEAFNRKINMTN